MNTQNTPFTKTFLGAQLVRAVAFTIAFFCFAGLTYSVLVVGLDLPQWRMNGEAHRVNGYMLSGLAMLVFGTLAYHIADLSNKTLKSFKLVVVKVADKEDEI